MGELERAERSHRLDDVRVAGPAPATGLRRLSTAVGSLYDRALDAMLSTPQRITTATEARRLLDGHGHDNERVAEQVNRVALLALPVLKRMQQAGRFARLPVLRRLPVVASVAAVASIGSSLTRGVRDVQVIGSFVAARLEAAAGGAPVDAELVKRVTVQLYLDPSRPVRIDRRVGPARLVRRWVTRGVLGRDARRAASRSVDAVAALDAPGALAAWRASAVR